MINVGICDDDSSILKFIKDTLTSISKAEKLKINIKCFTTGKDLIDFYKISPHKCDILFLDILLDSVNGLDLAKKINAYNFNTKIILISNSKDYILDGYNVNATNYLLKPLRKEDIYKEFFKVLNLLNKDIHNYFKFVNNGSVNIIPVKDIFCFEAFRRKVIIHLDDKSLEFYGKISDIEKQMKKYNFIKCHRSYIVNLNKIKSLYSSELVLLNNQKIPISKSYFLNIKDSLLSFINDT